MRVVRVSGFFSDPIFPGRKISIFYTTNVVIISDQYIINYEIQAQCSFLAVKLTDKIPSNSG